MFFTTDFQLPDKFSNKTHMKVLTGMAKLKSIGHNKPSYRLAQIASDYLHSDSGYRAYCGELCKWQFMERHKDKSRYELTALGLRAVGDPPAFDLREFHASIKRKLKGDRQRVIFDKLADGTNGVSLSKNDLCGALCVNPDQDSGFVKLLGNMRKEKWVEDVEGSDGMIRLTAICYPTTGQDL